MTPTEFLRQYDRLMAIERKLQDAMVEMGHCSVKACARLLLALRDASPLPATSLGALAAHSNATYLIHKLTDAGLVEKRPLGDDRRVTMVYMTARGRELADRLAETLAQEV